MMRSTHELSGEPGQAPFGLLIGSKTDMETFDPSHGRSSLPGFTKGPFTAGPV